MALPVSYSFPTDTGDLSSLADWGQAGATSNAGAVSGGVYVDPTATTADKSAYWVTDTFDNDQYAQITISNLFGTDTDRAGVILRAGAGNEALLIRYLLNNGTFEAYYWNSSGSRISLGSAHTPSDTVAVGSIIRAEIEGTTLTLKVDYGSGFVTETSWDASAGPASGSAGLYIVDNDSDVAYSNFSAGNITAPLGPSISNITDPITSGGSVTITGTDFGATQGSGGVTQNGLTVTETAWGDPSVTFDSVDIESSSLAYGVHTFELTTDGANSDKITATVNPSANRDVVTFGTLATAGDRITATPSLATGDDAAWDTRLFDAAGATPTAYGVQINTDGTFTLIGGPIPDGTYTIKDIRVWDSGDSTWGNLVDQTVTITSVVDETAPVLSSPTGTETGETAASGTVTTDEGNGTLYYYASTNSSETAAVIKASGNSQVVNSTGVQNVSFTGLTQATTYYAHYVQDDAASNESNVVSSASFTTEDTPDLIAPVLSSPTGTATGVLQLAVQ